MPARILREMAAGQRAGDGAEQGGGAEHRHADRLPPARQSRGDDGRRGGISAPPVKPRLPPTSARMRKPAYQTISGATVRRH